jgi:hypothetical protein
MDRLGKVKYGWVSYGYLIYGKIRRYGLVSVGFIRL